VPKAGRSVSRFDRTRPTTCERQIQTQAHSCSTVVVRALDLRLKRSLVRISAAPLSGNNLGQVVHTHVPLSPSSIIWYWSRGGDVLRLGM